MNKDNSIDHELVKKLALLKDSPMRSPRQEEEGLAAFLADAKTHPLPVTPDQKLRHKGWMRAIQSLFMIQRKERSPMFSTLTTILIIASVIFGGGGLTLAAAQNSQADQPLYDVKVMSEDFQESMITETQAKLQLVLGFTDRRVAEIQVMARSQNTLPNSLQARYQNQVQQAIQLAVSLGDPQASAALQQVQTRLQTQQQVLLQIRTNGSEKTEAALAWVREMVRAQIKTVGEGLVDPSPLREQLRQRDHVRQSTSAPQGPSGLNTPQAGSGNPWTSETPTPGSGYGPGSGTGECAACTPSNSSNGQGGSPWTTGTPTPGSGYGYGPGPEPTLTCTPGTGMGPQPTQQKVNQPTQAGPQPTQQQVNQPTQAGPQPTQQQVNQPTQAGPQPTQGQRSTQTGPGPQTSSTPGGPGGNR